MGQLCDLWTCILKWLSLNDPFCVRGRGLTAHSWDNWDHRGLESTSILRELKTSVYKVVTLPGQKSLTAQRPATCRKVEQTGWLAGTWQCPTSLFNYLHLWVKQPQCNGLINLLIAQSTQCNYIREFRSPSATSINSERTTSLP